MQLFIQKQVEKDNTLITFDKTESRHIVKVLRKKEGDTIHVTNGLGMLFTCKLEIVNNNQCVAHIMETKQEEPRSYSLHMAIAPTKTNDRFEWLLEKATEIGIDEITPILCAYSERRKIRLDRYERVIESALKQSLQTYLPKINPLTPLADLFDNTATYDAVFIAHCDENNPRVSLKDKLEPNKNYLILIGPEGDFSPEEIEKARKNKWQEVHLGTTRLRTETAGIVACHSVAFINE